MKSPLFFINDQRLSVMNLKKSNVDKEVLQQLIIDAMMRGLDGQRVSVEDIKTNLASNGRSRGFGFAKLNTTSTYWPAFAISITIIVMQKTTSLGVEPDQKIIKYPGLYVNSRWRIKSRRNNKPNDASQKNEEIQS
mmetsp:Transcript_24441/g.29527  ORF Transcript_24441/g.29527 Transcript_24441/m.29527 type:complete len:136 (+) Transcript_24441:165-572(+)